MRSVVALCVVCCVVAVASELDVEDLGPGAVQEVVPLQETLGHAVGSKAALAGDGQVSVQELPHDTDLGESAGDSAPAGTQLGAGAGRRKRRHSHRRHKKHRRKSSARRRYRGKKRTKPRKSKRPKKARRSKKPRKSRKPKKRVKKMIRRPKQSNEGPGMPAGVIKAMQKCAKKYPECGGASKRSLPKACARDQDSSACARCKACAMGKNNVDDEDQDEGPGMPAGVIKAMQKCAKKHPECGGASKRSLPKACARDQDSSACARCKACAMGKPSKKGSSSKAGKPRPKSECLPQCKYSCRDLQGNDDPVSVQCGSCPRTSKCHPGAAGYKKGSSSKAGKPRSKAGKPTPMAGKPRSKAGKPRPKPECLPQCTAPCRELQGNDDPVSVQCGACPRTSECHPGAAGYKKEKWGGLSSEKAQKAYRRAMNGGGQKTIKKAQKAVMKSLIKVTDAPPGAKKGMTVTSVKSTSSKAQRVKTILAKAKKIRKIQKKARKAKKNTKKGSKKKRSRKSKKRKSTKHSKKRSRKSKASIKMRKAPAGSKPGITVAQVKSAKRGSKITVDKAPAGSKPGITVVKVKGTGAKIVPGKSVKTGAKMIVDKAPAGSKPSMSVEMVKGTGAKIVPGMVITLQSGQGRYCSTKQCSSAKVGAMEKMLVVDAGDGYLALRGGDHTCGSKCGKKHVDSAESKGDASKLKISVTGKGKLTIKLKGGGFCRHTSAIKTKFACDASKVSNKTIFNFSVLSKGKVQQANELGEASNGAGTWLIGRD